MDIKALEKLPDDKITLICTGSQGEPMAALARMANRDHPIRIGPGDTVLMASSLIPGNENAIYGVINALTRWGANVVHKGNAKVHVSGHASAGELAYCYNVVRPANVMPVHGEWRHLQANAAIAIRTGIPADRVVLAEDGVVVDLVKGRVTITGKVPAGLVYVEGSTVGDITEASLKDRRDPRRRRGHHRDRPRRRRHRRPRRAARLPRPRVRPRPAAPSTPPSPHREGAGEGSLRGHRRHARQLEQIIGRTVSRWAQQQRSPQPDRHPRRHRRVGRRCHG